MNDTSDMQQRINVSKDYASLQGAVAVIGGLGFVLAGLTRMAFWVPILSGIGTALASDWYAKRYGTARATNRQTAVTVVLSILALLLITAAAATDGWYPGPILWCPLVSAVLLGVGDYLGLRHVGMTRWHWICVAAVAACALIPLTGFHPGGFGALVPLGVALMVLGVVDHRRLVAALGEGAQA